MYCHTLPYTAIISPLLVATLLRFEKEEFVTNAHQKTVKNKRKNSNLV
jgi:hypothetical protein